MPNPGQLAKIHIAKKALGMGDDEYRDMLSYRYGVLSSRDLSVQQADDLLGHFEECGWQPTGTRRVGAEKRPLLGKIDALLLDGRKSKAYADGIAKRMFKVDKVEWLTPVQLRAVVAALVKQARKEGRTG